MEEKAKTRLTFENYGAKYSWETPHNDVDIDDIINAFYGILIGATWQPVTIVEAFKDFVNDHDITDEEMN